MGLTLATNIFSYHWAEPIIHRMAVLNTFQLVSLQPHGVNIKVRTQ